MSYVPACLWMLQTDMTLGTSLNPNRVRSIGVFFFFVPKMFLKCDSVGGTFVLNASQKGGA